MEARLRERTIGRRMLGLLALMALALKIMVPAGFMPGTSLAAPIILCPDQGPMPPMAMGVAMAHGGDHRPSQAPHHGADHPCAFAAFAGTPLFTPADLPVLPPAAAEPQALVAGVRATTPGRGLAAPPPPSHAPPSLRA